MTGRWDVVVVGARVAGASTALLLARAGLRVVCLDRGPYGGDTLSTHALMRAGVLQLRRWGLLDAVVAAGTPAVRHVDFHYGGDPVSVPIRPAAGVDALYAPRRTVLDALIVDAARAAGAEVRFGCTATGVERDGAGRVSGLAVRGLGVVRAGLVVGADGRRSLVADAVDAPVEVTGRAASAFLYGYWSGLDVRGYEWFYRPGATAGAIPTNDGLTCVFVGARPERVAELVGAGGAFGAFARLAADSGVDARLRGGRRVGGVRYVRARTGVLRRSWGDGWALVGDAGHWKDPLSTHGMTDALRDAELLARAVVSAPEPGGGQLAALAGYQRVRDRMAIPMLTVSDRVASYDWSPAELRQLLRSLSDAMADEVELLTALPAMPVLPAAPAHR